MSKSMTSPTATLLRNSRLFSLPRALPAPIAPPTASGLLRHSDSATLPYPTHQAITAPATSVKRGDWGLKRALPRKGTRSGSPVRIIAQDTYAHITDFMSAGDHVKSLEKFNEMGIPMVKRNERTTMSGSSRDKTTISVYEEEMDNTDRYWAQRQGMNSKHSQGRWKYAGPWIASMTEGEFSTFVESQVSKRAGEWRSFLRNKLTQDGYSEARQQALDTGTIGTFQKTLQDFVPAETAVSDYETELRQEHIYKNLNSDLTRLLVQFLDLPILQSEQKPLLKTKETNFINEVTQQLGFGDLNTGPPSTHPGAGLSHLRTSAVLENHPLHGPQAQRSPVLSRVLSPRQTATSQITQARVGVGGFVALDPQTARFTPDKYTKASAAAASQEGSAQKYDPDELTKQHDFSLPGGNKMWVHPEHASIDENSRIMLQISRGDKESIAVKTGDVQYIHDAKAASDKFSPGTFGRQANLYSTGKQAAPANYGYALPDMRQTQSQQHGNAPAGMRRSPQVKGLDEELARPGGSGNEAADRIRELVQQQQRQR